MYLWNVEELARQLKNNTLPKWELYTFYVISPLLSVFNILFLGSLLMSHQFISHFFAHFLTKYHPQMHFYNVVAVASSVLTFIITCAGFYLCYRTNKQGDGKNFSERMACLSFPINFYLIMLVFAMIGVCAIIGYIILHVELIIFKKHFLQLSEQDKTVTEIVKTALKKTTIESVVSQVKKSSGFLSSLLKAPVTVLQLPTIPGKINTFLKELRATILAVYPAAACIPPLLSFFHYFFLQRTLKKINQMNKALS